MEGWVGIFIPNFAWFANIFWLAALLFSVAKKYKTSLVLFATGFIIGLQSFFPMSWPANEGGVGPDVVVQYLGLGFYVWELSFVLMAISCFLKLKK